MFNYDSNATTIHIIDGQNISSIQQHLSNNDTDNYNPCLPLPFTVNTAITITFNNTNISDFEQWYPMKICEQLQILYRNEYFFDSKTSSITINNLRISDYNLSENLIKGLIRVSDDSSSLTCNQCRFTNISANEKSLNTAKFRMIFENSEFINIQTSYRLFEIEESKLWYFSGATSIFV